MNVVTNSLLNKIFNKIGNNITNLEIESDLSDYAVVRFNYNEDRYRVANCGIVERVEGGLLKSDGSTRQLNNMIFGK